MTPEQQERVIRVVDAVFDLPSDRRVELIAAICADDPVVCAEAIRLAGADLSLDKKLGQLADLFEETTTLDPAMETAPLQAGNAPPSHPTILGRYQIIRLLGQGGMGGVFLAEQRLPIQRTVAIKLIRAGFDSGYMYFMERPAGPISAPVLRFQSSFSTKQQALNRYPNIESKLSIPATVRQAQEAS